MKNIQIIILCLFMGFISCKTDNSTKDNSISPFLISMDKLKNEPGAANAKSFIVELRKELSGSTDSERNQDLLLKGLGVSEEYKLGPSAISFLMPLVKDYPQSPFHEEHLAKLASALQDIGQSNPGDVLIKAYDEIYPNGKFKAELNKKRKQDITNIDTFITTMAAKIFENPDQFGINKGAAQKYVDVCEATALGFPMHAGVPEYLYRAAEMARTLKTFPKALSLFEWIEEKYPDFEKTPTTVFLKGFMLENELKDKEAARKVYEMFLQKYQNHELADDVQFLLDNIDKTDEEIMKMIDEKAAKK